MLLSALAGLVAQAVFEFGPLWLVAFAAPAALFGPYWAALVSTLGLGGYLITKMNLERRRTVILLTCVGPAATISLALSRSIAVAVLAQAALALLLAIIGIHAGRLLHDSIPSAIRTGVASGVGTLTWVLFLPFSLVLGWFAREQGVQRAGWILTGAVVLVGLLLIASTFRSGIQPAPTEIASADLGPADLACKELVELVTDYLDRVLAPDWRAGFEDHLAGCDGCTAYVQQIRTTLRALDRLKDAELPVQATGAAEGATT
jgi:hypothetical protein